MSLELAYGGLRLPRGYAEIGKVYDGWPVSPDGAVPLASWVKRHIVECHAGDQRGPMPGLEHLYFQCHVLAEPIFREAFRLIALECPGELCSAASFVPRRMRHDTPAKAKARGNKPPLFPLSTHTDGIAGDINSDLNDAEYGWHDAPWSARWKARWPHGVTPALVEIMEGLGFAWGGRWKGFCDPMHFELVYHADGVHPHDEAQHVMDAASAAVLAGDAVSAVQTFVGMF
jgi:hypothetical protein